MNKNIAILLILGIIIITSGCAPIENWVETIMSDTTNVKTNEEEQVKTNSEEESGKCTTKVPKSRGLGIGR